ncbi:MAG: hypothetical protein PWQ69_790, partial [Methanomicrobiaceae archaeon]|nr:hypothetical protein [Methanomicrobiaceae archaeon]
GQCVAIAPMAVPGDGDRISGSVR